MSLVISLEFLKQNAFMEGKYAFNSCILRHEYHILVIDIRETYF